MAGKERAHCNKDKEGTPLRQEKTKFMLRRMVRVSNNDLSEIITLPETTRSQGQMKGRQQEYVSNDKCFAPFSITQGLTDLSTM